MVIPSRLAIVVLSCSLLLSLAGCAAKQPLQHAGASGTPPAEADSSTAAPADAVSPAPSGTNPQANPPGTSGGQTQSAPDAPVPTAATEPDDELVGRIYEALNESRSTYQSGIELILAGEEILGEEHLRQARNELYATAQLCRQVAGCDMVRVMDVFDHLMSDQSFELKRQAYRIAELEESAETDTEWEPGTSVFSAEIPELSRTESLLKGADFKEMITLNAPVKAAIDDWLTWMRPALMQSYENYQFLRDSIAPIYEEAGLPEALLFAMIATETNGKVHAYSRAGAAGLLQFMRYTGRKYGLNTVNGFDERLDPVAATRANVAYLNDRFRELNESLEKALAAYNGGEGRMRSLEKRYNGVSLWDSRVYYSLPRETREYVPRILAAAWLFMHPEDYNLEFPSHDTRLTQLELARETSIGELTICLGQTLNQNGWYRTLRNLNPRLNPSDRIDAGGMITVPEVLVPMYQERCTGDGDLLVRARELYEANYPEEPEMVRYVVRRGDTLGKIAGRFRCVSLRELAAINNIRAPRYVIQVGQTLKVPGCS